MNLTLSSIDVAMTLVALGVLYMLLLFYLVVPVVHVVENCQISQHLVGVL